ncbi:unnamed protein product [Amoebophrya sp. A120]|nr:unnamed protein product [Amoebophrya sp. A120]|eukprot:GSA120T00005067001.1
MPSSASTDFHLRYLVTRAREESKDTSVLGNIRPLVRNAFAILNTNFDKFLENEFSADLLVQYAEVALLVPPPLNVTNIERALDLFDRCTASNSQWVARGLLVRAQVEAKKNLAEMKGDHLVVQVKHALSYLRQAIKIAEQAEFKSRYNFIVYNATLLYWDLVRPLCRINGWQNRVLEETRELLTALTTITSQVDGYVQSRSPVALQWRIEFLLNLAFGLDDNNQTADAQKLLDEALNVVKTVEADPAVELPHWVRPLVEAARAHMFRGNAKPVLGQDPHSVTLFIQNKGISAPNEVEGELVKYWVSFDKAFDEFWKSQGKAYVERPGNDLNIPDVQIKLAGALKAATTAGNFNLARTMYARILLLRAPPPRGRILIDMAKSQIDVWNACNLIEYKAETGMVLSPEEQWEREVSARVQAVRLCEQCIVAGKRIESLDLVEESATLVYNFSVPLLQTKYRAQVHKSLSRAAEVLAELQSNLFILRTLLHYEAARCEVASDLLTKGQEELNKAKALDETRNVDRELKDAEKPKPADEAELAKTGTQLDPNPFTRRMRTQAVNPLSHLLKWKLNLYDDPESLDQIMLWLDQEPITANVIRKAYQKLLVEEFEPLYKEINEDMLRHKYVKLPQWIDEPTKPITPYNPAHAPCTVVPATTDVTVSVNSMDTRAKSDREIGIEKMKLIALFFAQCSARAWEKKMPYKDVLEMCDRALFIEKFLKFGPWPAEIEPAVALAQVAFRKAEVLCEELDSVCGIAEETVYALFSGTEEDEEPMVELEPEEYAERNATKRTIVDLVLYGLEIADRFQQGWLVFNGIVHFWNFHLSLFDVMAEFQQRNNDAAIAKSLGQNPDPVPPLLFLNDFFRGVRGCLQFADKYFINSQSTVLRNLSLLYMDSYAFFASASGTSVNAGSDKPDLPPVATDPILQALLTKLRKTARKEVAARLTKSALALQGPATAVSVSAAAAESHKLLYPDMQFGGEPLALEGNRKTELRIEGDVTKLCEQITVVTQQNEKVMPLVTQCVDLLNTWQPRFEDEEEATLFLELWTRLGRNCLACFSPDVNKTGPKYGLMCAIRALRGLDVQNIQAAPVEEKKEKKKKSSSSKMDDPTLNQAVTPVARRPAHCSDLRSAWRGAAFALCGASLATLVNPSAQEKNSVSTLRCTAVLQFAAALEHCTEAELHGNLALYSAQRLYNVASALLQTDRQSRLFVLNPLLTAARVLSTLKLQEDPELLLSLYSSAYSVYAQDLQDWAKIQLVLNAAFKIVPPEFQRKLWALRMVALSKQGKNVQVAMGKMKESQATAQANIWIILAHSAVKPQEQLDAYKKAIDILQKASQYSVVDVQLELADWLSARGDELAAYEIARHAADLLLDVEEDQAAEQLDDEAAMTGSQVSSRRSRSKGPKSSKKPGSVGSKRSGSQKSKGAGAGSAISRARSSRGPSRSSSAGSTSKQSKNALMNANDTAIPQKLNALHYEHILRAHVAQLAYARSADDLHSSLSACVHFITRIFESTIDLANQCAVAVYSKKIADLIEEQEKNKAKLENQLAGGVADEPVVAKPMALPFCCSSDDFCAYGKAYDTAEFGTKEMSDLEKQNSVILLDRVAFAKTNFQVVLTMVNRGLPTVADIENQTVEEYFYAGNPGMFAKPILTFWALIRLEKTLEQQAYYSHLFPVLDLHQLLVNQYWGLELADIARVNAAMTPEQVGKMTVFEKEQKKLREDRKLTVKKTLDCLLALKRSRFCHLLRLFEDATKHWTMGSDFLYKIESTLPDFRQEADAAFARRVVVEEKKPDAASAEPGGEQEGETAPPEQATVKEDDLTKLLRGEKDPIEDKNLLDPESLDLSSVFADDSRAEALRCSDKIKVCEIWLLIAEECFEIGEYSLAGKLLAETRYHARCYGDTRMFREASILQAKVLIAEGRAELVLREILRLQYRVQGMEVLLLIDVVDLAQAAYQQLQAPNVFVEDLLSSGLAYFREVRNAELSPSQAMLKHQQLAAGILSEPAIVPSGGTAQPVPSESPAVSPMSKRSRGNIAPSGSSGRSVGAAAAQNNITGAFSPGGASSVMTGAAFSSAPGGFRGGAPSKRMQASVLAELAAGTVNVEKVGKLCRLLELEAFTHIGKVLQMQVSAKGFFDEVEKCWGFAAVLIDKLIGSGWYLNALESGLRYAREMEKVLSLLQDTYDPGQLLPSVLLAFEEKLLAMLDTLHFAKSELCKRLPSVAHLQSCCGPLSDLLLEIDICVSRHRAQRRALRHKEKLFQRGGSSSSTSNHALSRQNTAQYLASYFQLPGAETISVPMRHVAKQAALSLPGDTSVAIDVDGFFKPLKPVENLDVKDQYIEELTIRIDSENERKAGPRPAQEIEQCLSSIHSAYSELEYHQLAARYPSLWQETDRAASEEEQTSFGAFVPARVAAAEVEVGVLFVERGPCPFREAEWDETGKNALEEFERRAMLFEDCRSCESAEPVKNWETLAFAPPAEGAEGAGGESGTAVVVGTPMSPHVEAGKEFLEKALPSCLRHRHFKSGALACHTLAHSVYGPTDMKQTFHCLCMEQLFRVLDYGYDTILQTVLSCENSERILQQKLEAVRNKFPRPSMLPGFSDLVQQYSAQPSGELVDTLMQLPQDCDQLMRELIPPLTLTVSLQLEKDFMAVGAAFFPGAAATAPSRVKTKFSSASYTPGQCEYMCFKIPARRLDFFHFRQAFYDVFTRTEKDLIQKPSALSEKTMGEYEEAWQNVESFFEPLFARLKQEFFPLAGTQADRRPANLILLLDDMLFDLPLEHLDCVVSMFPRNQDCFVTRDVALPLLAARNSRRPPALLAEPINTVTFAEEPSKVDPKDATVKRVTLGLDGSVSKALVDANNEDQYVPQETGNLLKDFPTAPAALAKTFGDPVISPQTFIESLQLSKTLNYVGFSKLLMSLSSKQFGSLDLRNLNCLFMFCRAMNDKAFRRQKALFGDNLLANNESSYSTAVLATLRGVKSMVFTQSPVPVTQVQRLSNEFWTAFYSNRSTVSESLREPLYRVKAADDESAISGQVRPAATGEKVFYTRYQRAAMLAVGLSWILLDAGGAGGKKK